MVELGNSQINTVSEFRIEALLKFETCMATLKQQSSSAIIHLTRRSPLPIPGGAGGDIISAWIRHQPIHTSKASSQSFYGQRTMDGLVSPAKEIRAEILSPRSTMAISAGCRFGASAVIAKAKDVKAKDSVS